MIKPKFNVLWYEGSTEKDAYERDDYHTKEFYTRKKAIAFCDKHRNDKGKFGWWITRRDDTDWYVVEYIAK